MDANLFSAQDIVRLFIHTDKLHRNLIETKMTNLNLHRSQHIMLLCILEFEKTAAPTQCNLAEKLNISAATVAVTLKKLENAGYIKKTDSDCDNRCKKIYITEKGKEILNSAKKIFEEVDNATISGLSDKELSLFVETLRKIQDNLKNCGATLPKHIK